jgi:hypothetical protein
VLTQIEGFAQTKIRTTAMDQFLNALYLVHAASGMDDDARARIQTLLTQDIMRT